MNPLLLASLPSLFSAGVGAWQMAQGQEKLNGLERPEYKTPAQVNANLALAAQEYGSVGRTEQNARLDANMSAANQAMMARDAGMANQSASAIEARRVGSMRDIDVLAEQKRQNDMQRLMGANDVLAGYKDQEWQINKFAPYQQTYNEGREQIGAGQTNVQNGLSGISSIAQMYMAGRPAGLSAPAAASVTAPNVSQSQQTGKAISSYIDMPALLEYIRINNLGE